MAQHLGFLVDVKRIRPLARSGSFPIPDFGRVFPHTSLNLPRIISATPIAA